MSASTGERESVGESRGEITSRVRGERELQLQAEERMKECKRVKDRERECQECIPLVKGVLK